MIKDSMERLGNVNVPSWMARELGVRTGAHMLCSDGKDYYLGIKQQIPIPLPYGRQLDDIINKTNRYRLVKGPWSVGVKESEDGTGYTWETAHRLARAAVKDWRPY